MAWHAKEIGAYARDSVEAYDNAMEIYGVLSARGWTVNAVCGLLGNMGAESGYNPWRWQSDNVGSSSGSPWTNKGYGLVQFTPAGKYINTAQDLQGYAPNFSDKSGSPSDGIAQMIYVDEKEGYYRTARYPLSYEQYKASTQNAGYLAEAWLYNYERPADPGATKAARNEAGQYWYSVLSGETPPPYPSGTSSWMYGGVREVYRRILLLR